MTPRGTFIARSDDIAVEITQIPGAAQLLSFRYHSRGSIVTAPQYILESPWQMIALRRLDAHTPWKWLGIAIDARLMDDCSKLLIFKPPQSGERLVELQTIPLRGARRSQLQLSIFIPPRSRQLLIVEFFNYRKEDFDHIAERDSRTCFSAGAVHVLSEDQTEVQTATLYCKPHELTLPTERLRTAFVDRHGKLGVVIGKLTPAAEKSPPTIDWRALVFSNTDSASNKHIGDSYGYDLQISDGK